MDIANTALKNFLFYQNVISFTEFHNFPFCVIFCCHKETFPAKTAVMSG